MPMLSNSYCFLMKQNNCACKVERWVGNLQNTCPYSQLLTHVSINVVICVQRRMFSGQLCKRQLCNYPNTLGTTGWRGLAARSTPSVHTPTCTLVAGAPTPASEA